MSTVKEFGVIALFAWVTACGDASSGGMPLEAADDPPRSPDHERNAGGRDVGGSRGVDASDQVSGIEEASANRRALADHLGTSAAPSDLGAASFERLIRESSDPAGRAQDLAEAVSSFDEDPDLLADAMGVEDAAVREALGEVDFQAAADAARRGDTQAVDRIYAEYMRKIDEARNRNQD